MNTLTPFTKLYPVQKTLRFELKPTKETQQHIQNKGLLQEDEQLANDYKLAKKIIDEYHKDFINEVLSDFSFNVEELENFKNLYKNFKNDKKNNSYASNFKKGLNFLREKVAQAFDTKDIFKDKFIKEILPNWLEKHRDHLFIEDVEDPKALIYNFQQRTTYFEGFHENRKNIYTSKDHSTGIAYRIVHDNLLKFLDNIDKYADAKKLGVDFSEVEQDYGISLDEIFSIEYFNNCLSQSGIDHYNQIRGGQGKVGNEKEQGVNEKINLFAQQLTCKDANKKEISQKIKAVQSCKLEELYKQILSDRSQLSFRLESIKSDGELCHQIEHLFSFENGDLIGKQEVKDLATDEIHEQPYNISEHLYETIKHLKTANPNQLYVKNDKALADISQNLFGNWHVIKDSLNHYAEKEKLGTNKKGEPKVFSQTERKKWNDKAYFSFTEIHCALESYFEQFTNEELVQEQLSQNEKDTLKGISKEIKKVALSQPLFQYFKALKTNKRIAEKNEYEVVDLLKVIKNTHSKADSVIKKYYNTEEELLKSQAEAIEKLKNFLDSIMDLLHFLKPLSVKLSKKEENKSEIYEKDAAFYDDFDSLYRILEQIIPLYNQTRNYLTKKPFSVEKYKLNFNCPQLMKGFVDSKTDKSDNGTQYHAYLFRKRYTQKEFINDAFAFEYFLGVSEDKKLFRYHLKDEISSEHKSEYERLEYYQPKSTTFFSNEYTKNKSELLQIIVSLLKPYFQQEESGYYVEDNKNKFIELRDKLMSKDTPTGLLKAIEEDKEFEELTNQKVGIKTILFDKKVIEKCNDTIEEIKFYVSSYIENNADLKKVIDNTYIGCKGFRKIVEDLGKIAKSNKKFQFFSVNKDEFSEATNRNNKPLYLFKITNKDLSYYDSVISKKRNVNRGKKNMHTLYFEQLLTLGQKVIDIGAGEIFYRKKNPSYKVFIHRKGDPIVCKTYREDGKVKTVPGELYKELNKYYRGGIKESELSDESRKIKNKIETRTFNYDIIKNKRYTEDKFLFHLSINLNYSKPKNLLINKKVNQYLYQNRDVNIIGIDRGERHLAYYTIINQQGDILEQDTLNIVKHVKNDGTEVAKDYHNKLDLAEKARDEARKSWGTIEKIKDLKEGYLSQVIHKLSKLMIEHNAIIVFENLNFGFKKGRFRVEKQVYQKLERMLITKLNYLVFKNKESKEIGGVLNALQLTEPFTNFNALKEQTGFIFYVPAYHTSKVCPATGFVNLLYPQYETIKKAQDFFRKFKSIKFNPESDYFELEFKYNDFSDKAKGCRQDWVLCTYGERLETFKNPNKENRWDTRSVVLTQELKALFKAHKIKFLDGNCIIEALVQQSGAQFYKELIRLLRLSLQMRNSRIGTDEDWMLSPIKDNKGEFFDSRNSSNQMPENADANGAYHIALKGLMMLKQLDECEAGSVDKFRPDLSNKQWYKFIQNK